MRPEYGRDFTPYIGDKDNADEVEAAAYDAIGDVGDDVLVTVTQDGVVVESVAEVPE